MAITLVGSGQDFASSDADGFTSDTFDTAGADLIVVGLSQGNSITSGVITDNKGNTYTALTAQVGGGVSLKLSYAWNATTGSGHTFTVSGTDNFPSFTVLWFSGSQTSSNPFDDDAGLGEGFSSTVTTGSVTPTTDNQVLVTAWAGNNPGTPPTISSPFTVHVHVTNTDFGHQGCAIASEIQTTATSRNPTWTYHETTSHAAAIATFKAAAVVAEMPPGLGPDLQLSEHMQFVASLL